MTNPNAPILVDTGKRTKTVVDGKHYYVYSAPQAIVVTCPMENTDDGRKERRKLDEAAATITKALGGETHEI